MSVYLGEIKIAGMGGGGVAVDDVLSSTSMNPVQNKVITAALETAGTTQVSEHNTSIDAHPDLQAKIDKLSDKILALEIVGGVITTNPFAVTFSTLDGINLEDGVWTVAAGKLEF